MYSLSRINYSRLYNFEVVFLNEMTNTGHFLCCNKKCSSLRTQNLVVNILLLYCRYEKYLLNFAWRNKNDFLKLYSMF